MIELVHGAAVELAPCHEFVARLHQGVKGDHLRGMSGGYGERGRAALQGRDALLEDGLRELAKDVRGPTETEDDAYQRVKASRYVTKFKDDPDATFYRVDVRFGRVILTLNRAHPFFDNVYKVLADISTRTAALKESPSDDSDVPSDPELASETAKAPTVRRKRRSSASTTQR